MSNANDNRVFAVLRKYIVPITVVVVCALLFLPLKFGRDQLVWDRLSDAFHFPLFLMIALVIGYVLHRRGRAPQQCAFLALVGTAVLAAAVEIIQPYAGRGASWVDVRNGALGAVLGAGAVLVFLKRLANGLNIWLFSFALVSLVLGSSVYRAWEIVNWQKREFPILATFSNADELMLWQPYGGNEIKSAAEISPFPVAEGGDALKLTTGVGEWLGIGFKVNGLSWADYEHFVFTVFNPGAEFSLGLRIDDDKKCRRFEDRFNISVPVNPGPNKISIPIKAIIAGPKKRELNIKRISRVLFFVEKAERPQVIYFDDVHLE